MPITTTQIGNTPPVAPEYVLPNDPVWKSTWASATEEQKSNLAERWLHCLEQYDSVLTSHALFEHFLEYLDVDLPWVQEIQPYVNLVTYQTTTETHSWNIVAEILVGGVIEESLDLDAYRVMNKYFFGTAPAREKALADLITTTVMPFYYCPAATVRQAWAIASGGSGELFNAAKDISIYAGKSDHLPVTDIPEHAQLYQIVGYYQTRTAYSPPEKGIMSRAELKETIRQQRPSMAASLLMEVLRMHCYIGDGGREYLQKDSFLLEGVHSFNAVDVVKTWIPDRAVMLENAHSLGLTIVEACTLIGSESNPGNDMDLAAGLPADLTVDL